MFSKTDWFNVLHFAFRELTLCAMHAICWQDRGKANDHPRIGDDQCVGVEKVNERAHGVSEIGGGGVKSQLLQYEASNMKTILTFLLLLYCPISISKTMK